MEQKRAQPGGNIKQGISIDGTMPAFRSCGFLVLKKSPEGTPSQFLLMKHPNRYDLPKGHQEEGETDLDTAFRELWEETGITKEMVEVLEGFSNTHVYYPKYSRLGGKTVEKTVKLFAGYLTDPDFEVLPEEHDSFEWLEWKPPHQIQKNTVNPLLKDLETFLSSKKR